MNRASTIASLLLAVPLVACDTAGERADTGECPAGEVCSPATPRGLHFRGTSMADELFTGGPAATAIGGTQEVSLEFDRGNGDLVPLNLPYAADDDGALGIRFVAKSGSTVTVEGVRSRSNYLRIVDPATGELYDRYMLTGAALKSMRLVGTDFEALPSNRPDLAFATGEREIAVALVGDVQESSGSVAERIVDTSMVLDLPGTTRTGWDSIKFADAQPGTYPLMVTAGDKPAALMPIEIVASAAAVSLLSGDTPTVPANSSTTVCFQATTPNGKYIYGLTWSFDVDGRSETHGQSSLTRNCVSVSSAGKTSGSIPVSAFAGGKGISINVLVGAQALSRSGVGIAPALDRSNVPTAGDRAAM